MKKEIEQFVEEIHPIYVLLDWKWCSGNKAEKIPSKEDLEKTLTELVGNIKGNITSSKTGGLFAEKEDNENEQIKIGFEMAKYLPPKGRMLSIFRKCHKNRQS